MNTCLDIPHLGQFHGFLEWMIYHRYSFIMIQRMDQITLFHHLISHHLFIQALNVLSLRQDIGVLSLIDINIKRQDGRNFIDSPPEMERQTVEQEEIPPTGPRIWLPPRQHPDETLVKFHNCPHQDHSTLKERTLTHPPIEARQSARIPIPRFISDSTYGDKPPIQIERDLRGLVPIQEESMQVEPCPTNEEDDLGQMYSSK